MLVAANTAVLRQVQNLRKGLRDRFNLESDAKGWGERGWGMHVNGCMGEMAVAKALNVFWSGALGELRSADVGFRYQVRSARDPRNCLLLHESDDDDVAFILVIGPLAEPSSPPRFELTGWIRGRDGKLDEWWQDRSTRGRPCYFVPRDALSPMDELRNMVLEQSP